MGFTRSATTRHELIGYTDRPSAAPGEVIEFMISSEFDAYDVQLVRLQHADESDAGPGFVEHKVDHPVNGPHRGRRQSTPLGSYVDVEQPVPLGAEVTAHCWARPTVPRLGRDQIVLSCRDEAGAGLALGLDPEGRPFVEVGSGQARRRALGPTALRPNQWYFLTASVDGVSGTLRVSAELGTDWPVADRFQSEEVAGVDWEPVVGRLLVAAGALEASSVDDRPIPTGLFNGRIEGPTLWGRFLNRAVIDRLRDGSTPTEHDDLVGWWDFSEDDPAAFATNVITDRSGGGRHGVAVNFPTRAVLGHGWDRATFDVSEKPRAYGGIEFHDDDIEDCRWDPDVHLELPPSLPSAIYALRLRAGWDTHAATEDHIPFFVRPVRGQRTARIAYLASTITYQAYANESLLATAPGTDWAALTDIQIVADPYDMYVWDHPEFGYSIYDSHRDGTGINYSSWRRPILNMRPKHRYWVTGAPRHFAADLYPVDWMTHLGLDHDVVTDHDLHQEGLSLLAGYSVLITSSHPEYWTEPMQDALEQYLAGGGRLIYLGGNGFYWVTGVDPHRPHLIEVRRGYSSSRTWDGHPAESHLASTGERGGIWRFRGRPPNALTGVGFAAQGWSVTAPAFERLPDSDDPRAAFIFEGVDDRLIGDFGLVMNGAGGDEIDRCDEALGTPPHALRLATTQGRHSKFYLVTHEDLLVTSAAIDGTNNENVRSDMVYFEGPNGSQVFSFPAIGVSGALSHNGYANNVSRILENVVRRFIE